MLRKVADLTSTDFRQGLNTNRNLFSLTKNETPNIMDVVINYDGSMMKRFGTSTKNSVVIAQSGAASWAVDVAGTLTSSLQAFWPLNEVSGNRKDVFGGYTLIDNGNIGQSAGVRNQAAVLVAANSQYFSIANTAAFATGDIDFFISGWFYLNSTSTQLRQTIVSKRDGRSNGNIDPGGIDPRTVLMLHMDGVDASTTFTDASTSGKTVTANGNAQIDTGQAQFGGASGQFDGAGTSFLTVANVNDFVFGQSDFTIDTWVRYNSLTPQWRDLIDNGDGGNAQGVRIEYDSTNTQYTVYLNRSVFNFTNSQALSTWTHIAAVRSSTSIMFFKDGSQIGATTAIGNPNVNTTAPVVIGATSARTLLLNGWLDEFRVTKGVSRWISNFSTPTVAYTPVSEYEYWLYVETDNILTFRASSSGFQHDGVVRATSIGALNTSTWYNFVAWHDTGNFIGLSVNLSINSAAYSSGLRSGSAPFVVGAVSSGISSFLDGRADELGFWKRVSSAQNRTDLYNSGAGDTYQSAFTAAPWASFDFGSGSNNVRWLTVSAGTGVYASSNLGVSWVNIATDRTANYQYFERSKNVLIATSDSYDTPLAWAGSVGTYMTIVNSNAPLCKYSINFQGYLIMLNSNTRKRGFFFEDENTQLTGTWSTVFDIPSSFDDEITGAFILKKRLYCSTRYKLYNVSYVGGNPVWEYREMKDWGFVPRTAKKIFLKDAGEVVTGMDWSRKLRLFDGSEDKISSDNIEFDNGLCDFAMSKVSYAGSGLVVSFAETDANKNAYKLCVAIGEDSTQTTHFINFDGRIMSFYPDSNRPFNTMVMAESSNRRFLMAFDRSGFCHMLDSGNQDGGVRAVSDVYDSPLVYEKSPSQAQKGHKIDLFFGNTTSGRLYFYDRTNFDETFKQRETFVISGSDRKIVNHKSFDVPKAFNAYQWRVSTSGGTSAPWIMYREDMFEQSLGIGKEN